MNFFLGMLSYSKIFSLIALVAFACTLQAQNTGSIGGKLRDSAAKQNLTFATITVFKAKDTSIVTYRLSNLDGDFKIPHLPLDIPLRILVSYSGYEVLRLEAELTMERVDLNLGTLFMVPNSQPLDEVLVIAERPPVIVRNDTIEFNASSFKTLPNALVEDLLKKLPGVSVDKSGDITVNGKPVNRILVDGKDFFGSDPKIATRNLPANVIEKVQVVDDQDELDQNVLLSAANVGKVINLKLKKGVKKGVFGKVYGGLGTDDRYEAGGILNLFRDTLQVSAIGFSNNINRPAFSRDEVGSIGGFNRSGYTSSMIAKDGGFAIDGISFGGAADGIQRSTGAGINTNTELAKNLGLNIRYFYGDIDNELAESRNVKQSLGDSVLETRVKSSLISRNSSHRIGTTIRWKIDPYSTLSIMNALAFTRANSSRLLETESVHSIKGLLNESNNLQRIGEQYINANVSVNYRRNFKKRGRVLTIGSYLTISGRDNEQYNFVENSFYYPPSSTLLDQLRIKDNPHSRITLFAGFTEPLSAKTRLLVTHSVAYTKFEDNLSTFLKYNGGFKHDSLVEGLTNVLARRSWLNTSTIGMELQTGKLFITPSINVLFLTARNRFKQYKSPAQDYLHALPGLSFRWQGIFLNYTQSIVEPSAVSLQPVPENTNPLFIFQGNPDLKPTLSQSVYLTFDKYDTKKAVTYRFLFNSFFDRNGIITERTVDDKGIQTSRPLNASGLWNFRSNAAITKEFKRINHWSLSIRGGVYVDYRKTKLIINGNRATMGIWNINPSIYYSLNWNDLIEINQEYAPGIMRGRYNQSFFEDIKATTHYFTSELIVRLKNGIVLESSLDYVANPGVAQGITGSITRWNAAINFQFLKDRRANMKLSAFDLLNQNQEVTRTIAENYISDTRRTVLKRFFMLTVTYNIRDFRAKVGGRNKLLFL